MTRSLVRRSAALLVLSVLLAVPWSAAEPRQDPGAASRSLLGEIWSRLTALWSDIGCIADPNGGCHDSAATDIGCGADPNGGCSH